MRDTRYLILVSSLLLIACGKQDSSAWSEPSYGPAQARELSDSGKIHRYTEQVVSPAYRLTGVPMPEESQLTRPELVLVRHAHAVTQTFDWKMSNALWDPTSRAAFEAEMAKFKETPEDRVRKWKENYQGKHLEIYKRADVPGYVLFYVGVAGEPPENRKVALPLVVKQEKGRWWLTHDLREHPVLIKDFVSIIPAPQVTSRTEEKTFKFNGLVESITASQLLLGSGRKGDTVPIIVTKETRFYAEDGVTVIELNSFKVGDKVTVVGPDELTIQASKIRKGFHDNW
jgi:hypothetical protein